MFKMKLLSLILLSLLILPELAQAGSARRFMSVSADGFARRINGISSISSSGPTDTGTETFSTAAGEISVDASCSGGYDAVNVYLVVDTVTVQTLTCPVEVYAEAKLTHTVTAGDHSVRVHGLVEGISGLFSAGNIKIPLP